MENPLSSKIWEFFLVRELVALPSSRFIALDLCRFGSEYKKPTGILTTVASLEQLARRCNHPYRHIPAAGSVRVRDGGRYRWVARTTLAGAYPPQLCARWARLLRSQAAPAALSAPPFRWLCRVLACGRAPFSSMGPRLNFLALREAPRAPSANYELESKQMIPEHGPQTGYSFNIMRFARIMTL